MFRRRVLAFVLVAVGTASAAYAGGQYAIGSWRQQEARQAWEAGQARAAVAMALQTATSFDLAAFPVPGAPVARLLIPRLGLDEIVVEGVDDAALNAGPGHLPGSAFPGQSGNAVISAHRDRHFVRLGEVQVGDTVVTESGAGRSHWVVTAKRIVHAKAPALFRTKTPTLTLTTCWPIRYLGTAPDRLLITAKPVQAEKVGSFASVNGT